ncbi:MAG TPA: glycosyltransferase [Kofleriaceae bacterium]|nr:glycosyltransferase [Kofleriaceae bacterium]
MEEPVLDGTKPRLDLNTTREGVTVVRPTLPAGTDNQAIPRRLRELMGELVATQALERYVLWFYTPMAMAFARDLHPAAVVYDCMDELSNFQGAPAGLLAYETQLMAAADVVFTGGQSLYRAKCDRHPNVHAFPSAVDVPHFAQARSIVDEAADQASIPHPRVGFFGVIDERLDVELLGATARLRPDVHFVMVGPVVKIDPAILPQAPNVHWLGKRSYDELPAFIAGWEVAMMPFAKNDATRYISPTKTPEYLAAGRPVVSTSITDVVNPYQPLGLVRIADTAEEFARAIDEAMAENAETRQLVADDFLAQISWDQTWKRMDEQIEASILARGAAVLDTKVA